MTDAQMCLYFGWSFGSDMPRTYYHLSGKDLDDTILRMHGKKMDSEKKDPLQPIVCNRCQTANPADSPICGKCGLPFSEKLALEMENKQAELARLLKNPEVIEKMIDQRVRELLAEKGVKYGQ
jgi:ribosomal protein L40E